VKISQNRSILCRILANIESAGVALSPHFWPDIEDFEIPTIFQNQGGRPVCGRPPGVSSPRFNHCDGRIDQITVNVPM
jgi:hypothetical protein